MNVTYNSIEKSMRLAGELWSQGTPNQSRSVMNCYGPIHRIGKSPCILLMLLIIYSFSWFVSHTGQQEAFYQGLLTTEDCEDHALLFVSPHLLEALSLATEIHVNGTFKTVPGKFKQLMKFHVIRYNYVSYKFYISIHIFFFIILLLFL